MNNHAKITFHSKRYGEEILAMCRTHGIAFEYIEASLNERYHIVPAGSVDLSTIEIGKKRILENPSQRLDDIFYGAVMGAADARGKPVLIDRGEIFEEGDL